MSLLSPRLQLKVAQKQILTPGLVQMVTVLQLNRLELREMISQEIAENPVLEESTDEAGEELSPQEVQQLLETERVSSPADQSILEATNVDTDASSEALAEAEGEQSAAPGGAAATETAEVADSAEAKAADPFEEIDFGSFFDEYLDPGYKSPSSEQVDKPSFETFLSAPVTLGDYLRSQLSMIPLAGSDRLSLSEGTVRNHLSAAIQKVPL
jgi:RNA polymerase sigma-54 factor